MRLQKTEATCDSTFVLSNYEGQRGAERRSLVAWASVTSAFALTVVFI